MDTIYPNSGKRVTDDPITVDRTIEQALSDNKKKVPCEASVALVIDDSASIQGGEITQIRNGLQMFIDQQMGSNLTISFIYMSEYDTNNRTDHILEKKVNSRTYPIFTQWINDFRSGSGTNTDGWGSGFDVVLNDLNELPDIVLVISDGNDTLNTAALTNQINTINSTSHLFNYSIYTGAYDITNDAGEGAGDAPNIVACLNFYLNRSPILSTSGSDILVTDYAHITTFNQLGTALANLSAALIDSQTGCEVIFIQADNTNIANGLLEEGDPVSNINIGELAIRNNKTVAVTIPANSTIASSNGLNFKTAQAVTVPQNGGQENTQIRMSGTPQSEGTFSELINLANVNNPGDFTIDFEVAESTDVTININLNTVFQSPFLYLQAAGSEGLDSSKGRHLRWAFRGALGEKHLPKGNYASNTVNFNKPNDFVRIYRSNYIKQQITLNFRLEDPDVVDNSNYLWIYRFQSKEFYVYFRNTAKYDQVLSSISSFQDSYSFLQSYGDEVIEIENIKELFFGVKLSVAADVIGGQDSNGFIQVETLSVDNNTITTSKTVSNRRAFLPEEFSNISLLCENGRGIRYKTDQNFVNEITFEFYSDFITGINKSNGWQDLGEYSLTEEDTKAFSQLEPNPGDVHGIWQRFNDDAFVNIDNYKDKWNETPEPGDRNIKQVVERYIQLSNSASNPTAIESVPLGNDPNDPNDVLEVSNLDLLNLAGNDYHVARLLGLGILDLHSGPVIRDQKYVYVAEYFTSGDLEDGMGVRDVHHLFMSLPTGNDDFRLPTPIDLETIRPGLFIGDSGEPSPITNEGGYTHDGLSRYISLYNVALPENETNVPFYNSQNEIKLSEITTPVYGGLEHRVASSEWDKPEISNDPRYLNEVEVGKEPHAETRFIIIPSPESPYYVHRQTINGTHRYNSYGINWFSRAKSSSGILTINTLLKPKNPLKPPSNTNALLIREENPLLLTSQEEQDRLAAIPSGGDKTLIRLFFNYNTYQELRNYRVPADSTVTNQDLINFPNDPNILFPDNEEIFADHIDIFFRGKLPNNVSGKALSVVDHPTEEILAVIETGEYFIASTGETITPTIPSGTEANFVGGSFVLGDNKYIIKEVEAGVDGPKFSVYKKEISESIYDGEIPSLPTANELELPIITPDGLFMAIENMQTPASWGSPNPLSFNINVDVFDDIHREVIEFVNNEGGIERNVEKTRGIWEDATITKQLEPYQEPNGTISQQHQGLYKFEFTVFSLPQHPQHSNNDVSVDWFRGIIRVFTEGALQTTVPSKSRKSLEVLRIENDGTTLLVYAQDPSFPIESIEDPSFEYDYIKIGTNIEVNFYPGYKTYLYKDDSFNINEATTLPNEGEGMRYSIFGFRSHKDEEYSKISIPSILFAQELIPAIPPELPEGPLYTTRPDFFGRATYTLTTRYNHKPHGVLFYRSNDEALLNALYSNERTGIEAKSTIEKIRESLNNLGGTDEEYLTNRWRNFLNFEELASDGDFKVYPPKNVSPDGYKFPNPDKQAFFDWANSVLNNLNLPQITDPPGSLAVGDPKIINFVKGAIYSAFVPLTEVPIIYQYINNGNYKPINKKQVIRDSNGNVLPPGNEEFEMAPMMKIIGTTPDETLFTDFNIDSTSNNLYFYGVKELSTLLKMSEFSPFLGPIKQVNSNPPETPEIKRIIPVLKNEVLGTSPKIKLEINAYPKIQKIQKLNIYRAFNKLDALSVRTMQKVKTVDLIQDGIIDEPIWTVSDDFDDLSEVPYGDGLFYRVTLLRRIEYADKNDNIITEYAPSQPSKLVASIIVEVDAPTSPTLLFLSTPPSPSNQIDDVTLRWSKTAYNAKYHVYKMNSQGNWFKIHQLQSNDDDIQLNLYETDLQSDSLNLTDENGNKLYHHFKVIAENTAGMLSKEENILTIFNEEDWTEL